MMHSFGILFVRDARPCKNFGEQDAFFTAFIDKKPITWYNIY